MTLYHLTKGGSNISLFYSTEVQTRSSSSDLFLVKLSETPLDGEYILEWTILHKLPIQKHLNKWQKFSKPGTRELKIILQNISV